MPLKSKVLQDGKIIYLRPAGVLTFKVCDEIRMALEFTGKPGAKYVVDMKDVDDTDGSSISNLVKLRDYATKEKKKKVAFLNCRRDVMAKLDVPALDGLFHATESSGGSKILLVEDDRLTRKVLQRAIQQEIHRAHVEVAANGEKGILAAREGKPDLIVLDWVMPEFDGKFFLNKQLDAPEIADVPVIVHSVIEPNSIRSVLSRYPSVQTFVYKVLPPSSLLGAMRKVLKK